MGEGITISDHGNGETVIEEGITISDHGNGETVIEVREGSCQLFKSPEILKFFLIFLFLTFALLPSAFVVSIIIIILFLLIPKLFCRKVIIAFTPSGEKYCEISTKSYFQIGGYLRFMFASQSGTCAYGAIAFYETKGQGKFIITIPCTDSKKIRIWITYYPETLTKIINKILLLKKSESVAKSEVREDAVLNAENNYSTSIIDLLSMINPASCGIVRKNNHLIFDNKKSYVFNTFWHILGGTLLISSGLWILAGIAGISKSLGILIPPEPELSIGGSIGYSLVLIYFTLATALVFRGVYIIVKRLITAVLYQMVWFDNISQVITLEEQFPIYKSTQKYFWEKAELLIAKPQNAEDYLKDKKVLVLTLQKAGQPARRVELFKHQNEEYIQQLRDYILEFHREQDTDISDTIR
jgi:hypothetical protein